MSDPFDDAPLRYRLEDGGAIIYSIGRDEADNGGRQFDEYGSEFFEGTDITFTFGGLQRKLWTIKEHPADAYGPGWMGMDGSIGPDDADTTHKDNQESSRP